MRVAVFSPLPPSPTGIAEYSRLLVERLSERCPVEAYTEGDIGEAFEFPCYSYREFERRRSTPPEPIPVYQIGNSSPHGFVYPFVFRHPGVLVLHDIVLHHSRLAMYMKSPEVLAYKADMGDPVKRERARAKLADYRAEVEAAYPERGEEIAEVTIEMGGGRILYDYPLHELPVRASKLTLVHSRSARQKLLASCPGAEVRVVRMGVESPDVVSRAAARQRLDLGEGHLMASFGWVTPEKRISVALGCLRRLIDRGLDVRYLLVGGAVPHFDPLKQAQDLGIADRVRLTGRVSESDFWLYAAAADICLNLRYPSAGETSATLLRLLGAGKAVMITDQVQDLDLPDDVVSRVSLEGDEDGLYCDVVDLLKNPERRGRLERNARGYIEEEHSPEVMADDYFSVLEAATVLPAPSVALPRHLR